MPSRNLKVALLPIDMVFDDIEANIRQLHDRIYGLPDDIDLIVLPELCFSGYKKDAESMRALAQTDDGICMSNVRLWSVDRNAAICGSFIGISADGHIYNRGFMADPDSDSVYFYNKRHLFSSGGEQNVFTHGEELPPVITFRTWRLKQAICYDVRFPVWSRNYDLHYDALIVSSNWPNSRYYAWKHMLIARAIENQIYVAGCDREGVDDYGEYKRFDSMIINDWGQIISKNRDDGTLIGEFDGARLEHNRKQFTAWRDADDFKLKL